MKYENFKYLFPPRPEKMMEKSLLNEFDNLEYLGSPKYNGTNTTVYLDGKSEPLIYNREHKKLTSRSLSMGLPKNGINWNALHRGTGWMVLCGELFNKQKKDEHGENLKGFAIWDMLVFDGTYLIGKTVMERMDMLEYLFPTNRMKVTPKGFLQYEHLSFTEVEGVYKAPMYVGGFEVLYEKLVKTDLYEGLVLKKANAQLDFGFNAVNNQAWQLKIRKPTKNAQI